MPGRLPHARGVVRLADNEKAILVIFDRRLTDDEFRAFHGGLNIRHPAIVTPGRVVGLPRIAMDGVFAPEGRLSTDAGSDEDGAA